MLIRAKGVQAMWIRGGGGKTLIQKMWMKYFFLFNPSLTDSKCFEVPVDIE